ncbi:MAG TPA: ROK family protein [Acidobacteriota bacterium]|nr:ROK family protein [Acidobacteriota bacterium]
MLIGVDVGGTKIAAGLISDSQISHVIEFPVKSRASRKHVIEQICSAISALGVRGVTAIGVCVPSVVDSRTGKIISTKNIPALNNIAIASVLKKRFKRPVFVHNDAKAFALSQVRRGEKDVVGLIVGTGIGAGVVVDGNVLVGARGGAGEIGSILTADGKSLEYHLAGPAFNRRFRMSGKALFERASLGDKKALLAFKEYGASFATLLSILTLMYEPSRIVIGGSVATSSKFFLPTALSTLRKMHVNSKIPTVSAAIHAYPGILGAAHLCVIAKKAKHY